MTVIKFPIKDKDELTAEEIRRINSALNICEGIDTEELENFEKGSFLELMLCLFELMTKLNINLNKYAADFLKCRKDNGVPTQECRRSIRDRVVSKSDWHMRPPPPG